MRKVDFAEGVVRFKSPIAIHEFPALQGIPPNRKVRDGTLLSEILHRLKATAVLLTMRCAG